MYLVKVIYEIVFIILYLKIFNGILLFVVNNLDFGWLFEVFYSLELILFIFKIMIFVVCIIRFIFGCIFLII